MGYVLKAVLSSAQHPEYGNATEPPELRGDFLVCTKVSIGRN